MLDETAEFELKDNACASFSLFSLTPLSLTPPLLSSQKCRIKTVLQEYKKDLIKSGLESGM